MTAVKFMQVLDRHIYRELSRMAKARGINVQELIRVEIVPTFLYGPVVLDKRLIKRWAKMQTDLRRKVG